MQLCKSIVHGLSLSSCLGMAATAIAGPLISTKTERTAPQVSSINHAWLNELGRAEINLGKTAGKSLHGDVALLFPLQQDQQQLLFTQGNWRRSQGDTTLNLGVGQRWFNATAGYWGYNLFYDYQLQGHHQRLGLGVELRKNRLSWALNGYLPLSAKRGAITRLIRFVRRKALICGYNINPCSSPTGALHSRASVISATRWQRAINHSATTALQ